MRSCSKRLWWFLGRREDEGEFRLCSGGFDELTPSPPSFPVDVQDLEISTWLQCKQASRTSFLELGRVQ